MIYQDNPKKSLLSLREKKFVSSYSQLRNATQAALEAGYSPKSARNSGAALLKRPKIRAALNRIAKRDEGIVALKRRNILNKLGQSLDRDLSDFEDAKGHCITSLSELPKRVMAYVDGFEVIQQFGEDGEVVSQKIKVKLSSSAAAIELAMKHRGLFAAQKQDVNIHGTVTINWDNLFKSHRDDPDILDAYIVESSPKQITKAEKENRNEQEASDPV